MLQSTLNFFTPNTSNIQVFRLIVVRDRAWLLYLWWQQCYIWSEDIWQFPGWTACCPYQSKCHLHVHPESGWNLLPRKLPWARRLGSDPGMCPFSCHWPPYLDSLQSNYYLSMNYAPRMQSLLFGSPTNPSVLAGFFDLCSLDGILYHTYWIFSFSFSSYNCSSQTVQFLLTPSCQLIPSGPS